MECYKWIEENKRIQFEMKEILREHINAPIASKTKSKIDERIRALHELWQQFAENHAKILAEALPDNPYISENFYESAKSLYENAIQQVTKTHVINPPTRIKVPPTAPSTSTTGSEQQSDVEMKSQMDQSQLLRIKKMWIKLRNFDLIVNKIKDDVSSGMNSDKFNCKREMLMNLWSSITELNEEILINSIDDSEDFIKDQVYESALDEMNLTINSMLDAINQPTTSNNTSATTSSHDGRLPDLKIPFFTGEYKDWPNFKDIFTTLIHSNQSLNVVRKMEYLKTYVKDEPLRLISPYTISSKNYNDAWKMLESRYDNKRKMITMHLDNMNKPVGKVASASSIKNLHDSIVESCTALNNMGVDTSSWSPILVYHNLKHLDQESRTLFEQFNVTNPNEMPELDELLKFLESRYKALEILDPLRKDNQSSSKQVKANHVTCSTGSKPTSPNCTACKKGDHKLYACPVFIDWSAKKRLQHVQKIKVCVNCFQNHKTKQCESQHNCKHCNKRHNSMLHLDEKSTDEENSKPGTLAAIGFDDNGVILATAKIHVRDQFGNLVLVRALVDTGAQSNFITKQMASKLQLPIEKVSTTVTGIGKTKVNTVKGMVNLNIQPTFLSEFNMEVPTLVLGSKLTSRLPDAPVRESLPSSWPWLQLADKSFRIPAEIDVILGMRVFTKIILPEIHRSSESSLIAIGTELGCLIMGVSASVRTNYPSISSLVSISEVQQDIAKYWELEDVNADEKNLSSSDQFCLDHYQKTHQRLDNGRYEVQIPFKQQLMGQAELHTSRKIALSRYLQAEKNFDLKPDFGEKYKAVVREFINLGHMVLVQEVYGETDVFYMPHHAVLRPESSSTTLRVVFDGSITVSSGLSLNKLMYAGPRLQEDISTIILRWRRHQFVFTADVQQMYRQIRISKEHQRYQRVFWRESPSEAIQVYELTTVTYGTTAAPFLAINTLQQIARDHQQTFPVAAKIILDDFYVDDLLSGADSIEECKQLQDDIITMLKSAHFVLKKWSSNSNELLNNVNQSDVSCEWINLEEDSTVKTLGLVWIPKLDAFTFKVKQLDFSKIKHTKRSLLSDISKCFDPLGWLAPVTIKAKLMFQGTWRLDLDWNDPLPLELLEEWKSFRADIKNLENTRISRWMQTSSDSNIEVHGFCDASLKAYAAAVYVRVTQDGTTTSHLLMSKTKVAPVKQQLTIAKLELCGALLLSKLLNYVQKSFSWQDVKCFAWTDSTIALAWIKGDPCQWKMFVANRISQIQSMVDKSSWFHVPTKENPADCASRGITSTQLLSLTLWWSGPSWLIQSPTEWPNENQQLVPDEAERKRQHNVSLVTCTSDADSDDIEQIIQRFSEYSKMLHVLAQCHRFSSVCKGNVLCSTPVSAAELTTTEISVIRQVQMRAYHEEIQQLSCSKSIHRTSSLISLHPFLDADNLLRVGGRLEHSFLSYDEKHPIIIPRASYLTQLIIRDCHLKTCHGRVNLTESVLRRKFWIVRGRNVIKGLINNCVKCRTHNIKLESQLMGSLPSYRVQLNNPFYNTGVDYAGPITVKAWKGRCSKTYKAYIVLFICLSTKAVHLEVATDLSADGFIAAYRRFSFRRGPCLHIFSDCGTNFVGAFTIFQKNLRSYQKRWLEDIKSVTATGVTWHFNPPASPHMGGIWEAGVKSMKNHLYKTSTASMLTYEELTTLLIQIEGCLNSRPILRLTSSSDDLDILTPSHFLNGSALFSNPEPEPANLSLSTRWKLVQEQKLQFWKDWSSSFLQSLQPRKKWKITSENIKVNDVVLVEDKAVPSFKWPKAIVQEVHPGNDDIVRVVTLKMPSGKIMKRPIHKVGILPVAQSEDELHKHLSDDSTLVPSSTKAEKSKSSKCKRLPISTILSVIINLFAVMLLPFGKCAESLPVNITPVENNSGLFFAKVGDMKLGTSTWSMLMYYNMTAYFMEIGYLQSSVRQFEEKCNRHSTFIKHCEHIVADLSLQIDEINSNQDILFDLNHNHTQYFTRAKRSYMDIVGVGFNKAFGILDADYAKSLEATIEDLKGDDKHLLELLKNQTSISETMLQTFTLNEEHVAEQFKAVSQHIADLGERFNKIATQVDENQIAIQMHFVSQHLEMRSQRFLKIQKAIIEAVTDSHHGNFQKFLTPRVFNEQLSTIRTSTPAEVTIPVSQDHLMTLYNLLSVHTRVTEKYIIFKFLLPLVSTEKFEIYKPIPLPFRRDGKVFVLHPSTEFIAITIHRDKYLPISATELSKCAVIDNKSSLCEEHHPQQKNHVKHNSCEMSFFVHQTHLPESCQVTSFVSKQFWEQLPDPNKWVYSMDSSEIFNIICNDNIYKQTLQGTGIIDIRPGCTLEHEAMSIPGSNAISSTIIQSFYFPEVNTTLFDDHKRISHININRTSIMLRRTENLAALSSRINNLIQNSVLQGHAKTETLSVTGISLSGICILGLLVIVVIKIIKRFIKNRKPQGKREQPGLELQDM